MVNIMIADDNIELTEQLKYTLSKELDFKIINTVSNGLDALKCYKEQKPDVLILDLDMPKLNGIEFLNILPQYDNKRNIIIVSGSASYRANITNIDNVKRIYSKPYDLEMLVNTIKEITNINNLNNYDFLNAKIEKIFHELQLTPFERGAILLKRAIIVSYKEPELNLSEILNKVKDLNNEKM